jgi:hypothetical protein
MQLVLKKKKKLKWLGIDLFNKFRQRRLRFILELDVINALFRTFQEIDLNVAIVLIMIYVKIVTPREIIFYLIHSKEFHLFYSKRN